MAKETTRQEITEAILDAAERLLAHYGYGKMTMSDLAEEAGIGVGTIYLHFSSKAEVALAVIERSNRRVVEQLEAEARADASPPVRLRAMLEKRILLRYDIVRHRSHQLEEMRAMIRQQREMKKEITPGHVRWFEAETRIFAEVLQEGRKMGMFDFEDAVSTAETLLWAMDALMPRNLRPLDFEMPEVFRKKTHRLADFALRGLRPLDNSISSHP